MTTTAYERTLSPWLVRDDKALSDAILGRGALTDVFALARTLDRSVISLLHRLRTTQRRESTTQALERSGMWLDLDEGLDQEVEFWGLALSGVPVSLAWRWCVDDAEQDVTSVVPRPTLASIEAAMATTDLRPAMSLVRAAALLFEDEDQIESLRFLVTQPFAAVMEARRGVVSCFDVPTPKGVAQGVFGVFPGLADAAVFDGVRLIFKKKAAGRGKASKSTRSTSKKSCAATTASSGKPATKRAYKRKSARSKRSTSSSRAWWAKFKKTATKSATKTSGGGYAKKRTAPKADEEQYVITDGPRVIEYI
jgi:hypothetical protein